ncbi:hypothetical protein LINGRAHAP2_LOCUS12318, partial [Linum grandiflorum]
MNSLLWTEISRSHGSPKSPLGSAHGAEPDHCIPIPQVV